MARPRRKGRPCKFETLETRNLLAGDVTASIHHGDLIIKGDNLANGIEITAGATAGTVVITGVNAGGSATNVNGTANGAVTLSGFTDDLKINMKGGDDTVTITGLTVPDKGKLKGGDGDDTFTIDGSTFAKLKTKLGHGDDTLDISDTTVSVKTRLNGGHGTNTLTNDTSNSLTKLEQKNFVGTDDESSTPAENAPTSPTLAISGAASVNEGALYTLSLTSSGTGASSISQWAITWGDGSAAQVISGNPSSATHTYADGAGTRTISATATNPSGTFNAGNTVSVAVANVAPTLAISGPANINEGALYTLNLSSADLGADTISKWAITWGDGSAVQTVTGNPSSVTHTFTDGPATRTISATATDEDGTFNAGNTVAVTVGNVTPTLSITGAPSVNEGSLYILNLSATDLGTDTISQWAINWGDGSAVQTMTGNPSTVSHTFTDGPATRTISATATDEDGTFNATNTVSVTVANVVPTLAINGATSVQEGALYTLHLSSTDLGADTITQWTINWGDNTPSQVVTGNPSTVTHTFADGVRLCTIIATATDEDSTFAATNTLAVIVDNALPTLGISGASSVDEGSLYTLHLSSSDPGADTISQWNINWGDGTPIQVVVGNPTIVTHTFADGLETRTISATATDEDGTFDAGNTVTVTVNNIPPTLAISGAASVNEASGYELSLSRSDPGADTIDHWTIHWGDGTPDEVVSGNPTSAWHTFADGPANFTISATATDEDGTFAVANTVSVTVQNVPPSINLSGPSVVSEGVSSNWTLGPFVIDFGQDEISQVIMHWGDGTDESFPLGQVLGIGGLAHAYAAGPNAYTISIDLVDEDGTYVSVATEDVTVENVAPTVSVSYGATSNENTPVTISGNYFDADRTDAQTVTIAWDDPNNAAASTFALPATNAITAGDTFNSTTDGATLVVNSITDGYVSFSVAHTYPDDGPAPGDGTNSNTSLVTVTVTDDDGALGTSSTYLYVYDTPASLEFNWDGQIVEYANTTFYGAYTDPGLLDAQTLSISWNDSNNSAASTFQLPAVLDPSGTPMLSVGQTINSQTDNALLTITSIDKSTGRVGFSTQHQYVDDGPAPGDDYPSYYTTINSTITGDDSSPTSIYRYVSISNVAPTIAVDAPANVSEGTPVMLTGTFTDPGLVDGHTLLVTWNYSGYSYLSIASLFTLPAMRDPAGVATLNTGDTFQSGEGATLTITSVNPATGEVGFSIQRDLNDGSGYGNAGVNYPINIYVKVLDDDGDSNYVWTSVTVENVAPTLAVDLVAATSENSTATLSGMFTDPGRYDSHLVTVNWGDSSAAFPSVFSVPAFLDNYGAPALHVGDTFLAFYDSTTLTVTSVDLATATVGFSITHQYLDDGPWPGNGTPSDTNAISVSVSDDNNASDSTSRQIVVDNVTPTVALDPVPAINENGTANVTGTFTDAGTYDAHTLTVNWGDPNNGSPSTFNFPALNPYYYSYLSAGTSLSSTTDSAILTITSLDRTTGQIGFSVQHRYLDDGLAPGNVTESDVSVVSVTVTDDDGGSGSSARFVTISNAAPGIGLFVGFGSPPQFPENGNLGILGIYTDSALDAQTVTINWGDPNNAADSTFTIPAVEDSGGNEVLFTGNTFNSSTDGAVLTIAYVRLDIGEVSFSVQHKYINDGPAPGNNTDHDVSTITIKSTDDDGQSGTFAASLSIGNVNPSLALNAVPDTSINTTATLTGSFTDIGLLDNHVLSITWDDSGISAFGIPAIQDASGTPTLAVGNTFDSGSDSAVLTITSIDAVAGTVGFSVDHLYASDGIKSITASVLDWDTGYGVGSTTVTINSLPS
jgi:hypothetical protein